MTKGKNIPRQTGIYFNFVTKDSRGKFVPYRRLNHGSVCDSHEVPAERNDSAPCRLEDPGKCFLRNAGYSGFTSNIKKYQIGIETGGRKQCAVKPVEYSTVPGQNPGRVFDECFPF